MQLLSSDNEYKIIQSLSLIYTKGFVNMSLCNDMKGGQNFRHYFALSSINYNVWTK